jgi:hypothetical protein
MPARNGSTETVACRGEVEGRLSRCSGACYIDGEKLEQNNQKLKGASMHLSNETDGLQLRHDKQG